MVGKRDVYCMTSIHFGGSTKIEHTASKEEHGKAPSYQLVLRSAINLSHSIDQIIRVNQQHLR